jgi:hypothetical protein
MSRAAGTGPRGSHPAFSQRFTGTFDDDGDTITGRGSYSRDGGSWTEDLALTYRRR